MPSREMSGSHPTRSRAELVGPRVERLAELLLGGLHAGRFPARIVYENVRSQKLLEVAMSAVAAHVPVPLTQPHPLVPHGGSTATGRHPALLYLARLSPGSRRAMRAALDTLAGLLTHGRADLLSCPWSEVRYQHTQALRASLAVRYAPATANRHLAALRGVLKECWRLGLVEAEAYHRATDVERLRGVRLPAGREVSQGELRELFRACVAAASPGGARNAAALALLYGAGLRRAEAVALDLDDVEQGTGAVSVRSGKGQKARTVYVAGGALAAVQTWLAIRGPQAGPLLVPVNKAGRITIRRLTDQALFYALRRCAEQAGISRFSPHDLRRTFIGDMLDVGADIATVQRLVGHASPTTTSRYDRRGERAKRQAVALLHVPYCDVGPR